MKIRFLEGWRLKPITLFFLRISSYTRAFFKLAICDSSAEPALGKGLKTYSFQRWGGEEGREAQGSDKPSLQAILLLLKNFLFTTEMRSWQLYLHPLTHPIDKVDWCDVVIYKKYIYLVFIRFQVQSSQNPWTFLWWEQFKCLFLCSTSNLQGGDRGRVNSVSNGRWLNKSNLCNEASIKSQNYGFQRASRMVNTWRAGEWHPAEGVEPQDLFPYLALRLSSIWLFLL